MKHSKILSRQRGGRRVYYCNVDGKQYGLGPDIDLARKRFAELVGREVPTKGKATRSKTVGELVVLFDRWGGQFSSENTRKAYAGFLRRWVVSVGPNTPAHAIRPRHVDDFVVKSDYLNRWSHDFVIRAVSRLYNWSRKQGYLPSTVANPTHGCENINRPASPEIVFSPRQVAILMRNKNRPFAAVIRFMINTGCRVEEFRKARVGHVDLNARTVTIPWAIAKLGKRTRKDRVIRYPAKLDRFMRRRVDGRAPGQPLLANTRGGDFGIVCFNDLVRKRVRKKPEEFPQGGWGTCLRYTFTTWAIKRGVGPVELAKLLGHSDLKMIMKHYQKLGAETDHMQRALDLAVAKKKSTSS